MKRERYLGFIEKVINLFEFKDISDEAGNEYILFSDSNIESLEKIGIVNDRTEFEAAENHVHLINGIKKKEFGEFDQIGIKLGKALLHRLCNQYPTKKFAVYVSLSLDTMIIRFHQQWPNEPPYFEPLDIPYDKVYRYLN